MAAATYPADFLSFLSVLSGETDASYSLQARPLVGPALRPAVPHLPTGPDTTWGTSLRHPAMPAVRDLQMDCSLLLSLPVNIPTGGEPGGLEALR